MLYIINLTEQEHNALVNSVIRARNGVYNELNAMQQDYQHGGILNAQRYTEGVKVATVLNNLTLKLQEQTTIATAPETGCNRISRRTRV